jgi:hypothetical protein
MFYNNRQQAIDELLSMKGQRPITPAEYFSLPQHWTIETAANMVTQARNAKETQTRRA